MRKQAAGYSGLGKRNPPMIGRIQPASSTAGSRATLQTTFIPTSAADVDERAFCEFIPPVYEEGRWIVDNRLDDATDF